MYVILRICNPETNQDYIQIIQPEAAKQILLETEPVDKNETISIEWEELNIISIPNHPIYVTWDSLNKKFNKK